MALDYYDYFIEKTKGFVFSAEKELFDISWSVRHEKRVRSLVDQTRKMAVSFFYRTSTAVGKNFAQDDWIQHAMITLFECSESYDPKNGLFDHYVRYMVKRRLEDQRRKLYRKNPPAVDNGEQEGRRLFTGVSEDVRRKAKANRKVEPETQYIMEETRQILWACIDKLGGTAKMLFAKHEFEKMSFRKVYALVPDYPKAFATFKRWYQKEIYERVKRCVREKNPGQ